MRMVLASTSPRRREILGLLGLPFEVVPPRFREISDSSRSIEQEVLDFSAGKAASVARRIPDALIIGSDTLIRLGEKRIGKPSSRSHAVEILQQLAGREHDIFTGVAVIHAVQGIHWTHVERIRVRMRTYSRDEARRYVDTEEPLDKAGAYSIQGIGHKLIATISGDYLGAVGLPLRPIARYLEHLGVVMPHNVESLYEKKAFRNWPLF